MPNTNAALTTIPANFYLIFWANDETTQGKKRTNLSEAAVQFLNVVKQ